MEITFENVLSKIVESASDAFEDGWDSVKDYAPAEFKKISSQIVEIADNVVKYNDDNRKGYSAETGKLLLKMQRIATEGVLVAISTLTLIAVKKAINAIFSVLKNTFKGVLSAII